MDTDALVGRGALLEALSATLRGSAARGDALLLSGEAGIGRTACLRAAGAMARAAGHLALETEGAEAETKLPFAGLHRLLGPLLPSVDALPEVQRRALRTAFGLRDGGPGDRFLVSIATLALLEEAAGHRAVVITADDVQWLDEETRHVLAFVARRLAGSRVVVVATAPTGQVPGEFRDAFRDQRLDRLDESAVHRLLDRRRPQLSSAQRGWVAAQALGNPLALVELGTAVSSGALLPADSVDVAFPLTPPLERAFAGRLADLPQASRDVVLVAAVGSGASLQEVVAAGALLSGQRTTAAVLEAAQVLGLLTFDEVHVHFTHPLVRTAIAQKESTSRRQAAHRALGAVITVNSARRAWHRALGATALDDGIAGELERTAAECVARGDTAAALPALERAAQLSTAPVERARRLLLAARHAARLGRPGEVGRLLGLAGTDDLTDLDRVRAELLREDSEGLVIADSSRVLRLCSAAREAVAAGEIDLAVELADVAVRRRCATPVGAQALSEMTALARSLAGQAASSRAVAVLALADPVGHGRTVLSMLAEVDQDVLDGDDLGDYGVAARAVGSYSVASDLLDRAEGDLRIRGLLGPLARTLCVAADVRLDLGDWDRAQAALTEFASLAAASMSTSHRATALATTAKLAALRGDPAGALAMVSETEHSPGARSGSRYLARAQIVRGIAGLATGRHGDAFDALSRVFQPDDPSHHYREQFDAVAYLAEAAAHTGRQDEAADLVQRMQLIADASGSPMLTAQLAYATAVLASDDATEQLFLAGLASGAAASPWQRARLQLAYGRWLRRQQRVTHSRGPLRAALATLQDLGAERWAAEARDELTATGEPADAAPPSPLLSAQESTIAHLAARGLSNREIGQQLYLSPRTVSSHLYRIFPKLDISTRGQLAARLAGEPATSSVVRRSAGTGRPDAVDRPKPGGPPRS